MEDKTGYSASGRAYIFDTSTGNLLHTLDNPFPDSNDYFGYSVSISESYAIVGAYNTSSFLSSSIGRAYIFNTSTGNLLHSLLNPSAYGSSSGDRFGYSVAITESYAIVGAYLEDELNNTSSGKAYIFDTSTGNLVRTLDNPNYYDTAVGDYFGYSVAISESYAVVGAYLEDDEGGLSSGKAYIYNLVAPSNWLGIATEDIADTATGKIDLPGAINKNQTGLITNSTYYVSATGTLTSTFTSYRKIGKALSSTELQITDISSHNTDNLTEGTNLYYTDARVDARLASGSVGDVTIGGNLQVNGTTTTINTTNLTIEDKNIEISKGAVNGVASDGAGITVDLGTDGSATLTYSSGNDRWEMNKSLAASVIGNVTGQVSDLSNFSTTNLTEGSNLYYTDARVDARLASGSLGDVTIGGTVTADQYNNDEVRHSIRPSLLLDFANSKRLDPRITFTRSSTATYYDGKTFVLKTAANGEARFDHDPVTGESKGLLIEEQRTNLLTYSEEFSFSTWGTGNGTITRNAGLAPDGMMTADKYVPNNGASNSSIYQPELITSGHYYTWSCYAKQAGHQYIQLRLGDSGFSTATGRASVSVNLANGEVVATTDAGIEYTVENVGNGWYRITLTKDAISSSTGYTWIYPVGSNGSTSAYTGDGNNGFYIWGAQLEVGSFPTSYIRTGNAPATRSADAASMTGTNFSSWYRQDEGTLYADGSVTSTSSSIFLDINDSTALNRLSLYVSSADKAAGIVLINNVTQGSVASTNDFADRKASFAYAVNDYLALSYNGEAVATHTSGNLPVVSQANIGIRADGGNPLTGTIKKIAYYPTSLTNAELQTLTET